MTRSMCVTGLAACAAVCAALAIAYVVEASISEHHQVDVTGGSSLFTAVVLPPNPPFDDDALEPHVSKETVHFHYRHHQKGYVTKLNQWIGEQPSGGVAVPPSLHVSVVSELARYAPPLSAVRNLASQIFNHALYFACMSGPSGTELTTDSRLYSLLQRDFGTLDEFWAAFKSRAVGHFGSGWVWLVHNRSTDKLHIVDTHDAGTPLGLHDDEGAIIPLLVCDVWEHAYYIDRKHERSRYVEAWRSLVDWKFAERRLEGGVVEYQREGGYPKFLSDGAR